MSTYDVYLYKLDIKENGDEYFNNYCELKSYFTHYLLLADNVYMQGSAFLKSANVYRLFNEYKCFFINNAQTEQPLCSFTLRDGVDGYVHYLDSRFGELKKIDAGSEYQAYIKSDAVNSATKVDNELSSINVKRREGSVSKEQKNTIIQKLRYKAKIDTTSQIDDELFEKTIDYINSHNIIQTWDMINNVETRENQVIEFANILRSSYHLANAKANNSSLASNFDNPKYVYLNITTFLLNIGLDKETISSLTCSQISRIKDDKHFNFLRIFYLKCNYQEELKVFIDAIILSTHAQFIARFLYPCIKAVLRQIWDRDEDELPKVIQKSMDGIIILVCKELDKTHTEQIDYQLAENLAKFKRNLNYYTKAK